MRLHCKDIDNPAETFYPKLTEGFTLDFGKDYGIVVKLSAPPRRMVVDSGRAGEDTMKVDHLIYGTFPDTPGSQHVIYKSEGITPALQNWLIAFYDQFGDCRNESFLKSLSVCWYREQLGRAKDNYPSQPSREGFFRLLGRVATAFGDLYLGAIWLMWLQPDRDH